jgi:hypothetical protein
MREAAQPSIFVALVRVGGTMNWYTSYEARIWSKGLSHSASFDDNKNSIIDTARYDAAATAKTHHHDNSMENSILCGHRHRVDHAFHPEFFLYG